jgi:hypothetical protein
MKSKIPSHLAALVVGLAFGAWAFSWYTPILVGCCPAVVSAEVRRTVETPYW